LEFFWEIGCAYLLGLKGEFDSFLLVEEDSAECGRDNRNDCDL